MGYVGLSNAVLLNQYNEVVALGIVKERVDLLNEGVTAIEDAVISDYLTNKSLNLTATLDKRQALSAADYVTTATPTDYDPQTNYFDARSVESVVADVLPINPAATTVIKSWVPIGFTHSIKNQHATDNTFFSRRH